MKRFLHILVNDYSWIHSGIGLIGNLTFVIGSVFFLPHFSDYLTTGVWLFISGSALMMVGSIGEFLIRVPAIRDAGDG